MVTKKKKAKHAKALQTTANKASKKPGRKKLVSTAEERRAKKMEKRRLEKKAITAEMWAEPAPSHLVGKLDMPKLNSKYRTYFEIADNHEKKKKLEYTVTNDPNPPPGFAFVPIGDPNVTNKCKEISREREAMIFVVSDHKEENSKISEHVYRTGYHFRESIVEEVRQIIGETVISAALVPPGFVEPIPEDQDEINKQADRALRDLFPRIPNTDRQMIIDHAFKKGAMFAGEPTVGLQATIPLSRRVQLATLAHIRHTHTRYDKLLRETSWMNARKVVEPVCLDVLLKWRGDEETGRDQMDEILREVVIITDSEGDEDTSDEEYTSEDEGETTSSSSVNGSPERLSRNQSRIQHSRPTAASLNVQTRNDVTGPSRALQATSGHRDAGQRDKRAQKGFNRYRTALADAIHRRDNQVTAASRQQDRKSPMDMQSSQHGAAYHPQQPQSYRAPQNVSTYSSQPLRSHEVYPLLPQSEIPYSQPRPGGLIHRSQVDMRPLSDQPHYSQHSVPYLTTSSKPPQVVRERSLQDLLVPSIEAGADAFPSQSRPVERPRFSSARDEGFDPRHEFEHRRSPPRRQVIIIDDDSPQAKRPRVLHDRDAGQFQVPASLSRSSHIPPPRFEYSSRGGTLSAGAFLSSLSRIPQPSHHVSHALETPWISSGAEERLPVYDAPESGGFAHHPRQLGISEVEYRAASCHDGRDGFAREYGAITPHCEDNINTFRSDDQRDHGGRRYESQQHLSQSQHQRDDSPRYLSSNFAPSYEATRSHAPSSRPVAVDQNFVQSFSKSHLGSNATQRSDGVVVLSEGAQPSFSNYNGPLQYHENMQYRDQRVNPHYERPLNYGIDDRYQFRPGQQVERGGLPPYDQTIEAPTGPEYVVLD